MKWFEAGREDISWATPMRFSNMKTASKKRRVDMVADPGGPPLVRPGSSAWGPSLHENTATGEERASS